MDQETATGLGPARPAARRRPLLWIAAAIVLGLVLAVGGLIARLSSGPLRIDGMSERVAAAIAGSPPIFSSLSHLE